MEEEWKNIEFGGLQYLVSNYGRVEGMKRGLLKQRIDADGYMMVTVGINEKRTAIRVHRLVAIAFITNIDNKSEVNHKDFNRQNNNLDNLEWCTHQENIQYSCKYNNQVKKDASTGENNGRAILTEKDVLEIRELYKQHKNIALIARMFNRGWQTINHIIKKTTWVHV